MLLGFAKDVAIYIVVVVKLSTSRKRLRRTLI